MQQLTRVFFREIRAVGAARQAYEKNQRLAVIAEFADVGFSLRQSLRQPVAGLQRLEGEEEIGALRRPRRCALLSREIEVGCRVVLALGQG